MPKGTLHRLGSSEPIRIGAVPVLVLVMAFFFAFPWLPEPSPGGAALDRYSPARDGASLLVESYDKDGRLISTESQNLAMIPDLRTFTESRQGLREEIEKLYASPEDMDDAQVIEVRRRTLEGSGGISESTDTLILDPRGLRLLGSQGTDGTDIVFDDPALLLPADLGPESSWSSDGKAGSLDYELDGRVVGTGAFEGALGSFDDCLSVETRMILSPAASQDVRTTYKDRYCAGVGLVESRELDGSGEMTRRNTVVSTDGAPGEREARLCPASISPREEVSGDPADWRLGHFGRLMPTGESTASTIPPTYVPADPPVVLAAAQEGDLLALDAGKSPGTVRWRFHPDGTIYGPPAFDAETGRIYFGATDKKLYALDARGLFLWAFETGDNVASRPVVAGNTVVFGSENRNVYGLDAGTGEERWKVDTGGPVVSSPAYTDGVVVIGSDDGAVYGLDPSTGDRRWLYVARGPVEAPVTAENGVAYVASRSGELTALDSRTGKEIWSSSPGDVLRTAPALDDSKVFVVDDSYDLLAYDRQTGKKRWEIPDGSFVGPPLVVDDGLLVARSDGNVQLLDPDGKRAVGWDGALAGNPIDGKPTFSIGPTAGGGAVWAATDKAAVVRLGPATGPAHIEPAWADAFSSPPFSGDVPQYTATGYRGEALLLGAGNNVYLLNVESGKARRVGGPENASGGPVSEPVVTGDTLLVASGETLHAVHLPDGEPLWQFEGGVSFRPPVAAGEKVLWLSASGNSHTLRALDLGTGKVLWEAPVSSTGGVVVRGRTAYANPASAFDLETGRPLWHAETGSSASGGPALSEPGDVLFAGAGGGQGSVVAVDTRSGDQLWRAELEGEIVDPSDRLWISDDVLVVPTFSGDVIALDSSTGEKLWRYEPPLPRLGNVTVDRGSVWFALQNGEVLALDAESGKVVARSNDYSLNLNSSSFAQRPAFVGGKLVLGVGTYVLGFEPPGEAR
ncbi:MAG TPA: PQQ-binding-like beta-propeller repeat protein [Rubrobacter sp.]|nr:PQQ-binding-like beta-propeller repeat protein [Rubrobacter sp.]